MEIQEGNEAIQRPVEYAEEYNEEEDEDFDPSKVQEGSDENDEDDDLKPDQKSLTTYIDYSRIESDSGGLVRTRKARKLEEERLKRHKYESVEVESISEESSKLWEELKRKGLQRLNGNEGRRHIVNNKVGDTDAVDGSSDEKQILIKRNYKFANETVYEKKMVPISSAEAREYLSSTKFQKKDDNSANKNSLSKGGISNENGNTIRLRRPLKRPPLLEQIVSGALKPKLTTLEKSSLDWASYVDKEGINEELALHNKDGYLAKQDFLDRVESFKYQQYREFRQKQLTMHLQNGA